MPESAEKGLPTRPRGPRRTCAVRKAGSPTHLQGYLDEFAFRFNRRASGSRGLHFQRLLSVAVAARPEPYWRVIGRTAPNVTLAEVA